MGGQTRHRVTPRVRVRSEVRLLLWVLEVFEPVCGTDSPAQDTAQVVMGLHRGTATAGKDRFEGGGPDQIFLYALYKTGQRKKLVNVFL